MPRKFKRKIYVKDESFDPIYKSVNKDFLIKTRVAPGVLMAAGFLILGSQVVAPLVYFKTHDQTVAKPMEGSVLGVATGFSEFEFSELQKDQTKSDNVNPNTPEFFYITIPKLNIIDAIVEANSTNLSPDDALGHYNGTSMPGENGNAFIFGHSVLSWFYNSHNYKTIFSTLGKLETGDEFYITVNNRKLIYKVESKVLASPDEVKPLAKIKPDYLNESTVVLMTCWPAGTKAQRLMINAVLIND